MKNTFLDKIRAGEKTVGTFFEMGSGAVGEVIGTTSLDYFIIDCEHGPYDIETTAEIIRAAENSGNGSVTALARAKGIQRDAILKLLDIGAKGLIIPQVKTLEELQNIVRWGKYFPVGDRGYAWSRNNLFGRAEGADAGMKAWCAHCNEKQLLIPQCETVECLEHIEEFALVDGIDGFFVGPNDLSIAMGIPGEFDSPDFLAALERIEKAVHKAGKFLMIYVDTPKIGIRRLQSGYDSVTVSVDACVYVNALNRMVQDVKQPDN